MYLDERVASRFKTPDKGVTDAHYKHLGKLVFTMVGYGAGKGHLASRVRNEVASILVDIRRLVEGEDEQSRQ